MVEKRRAAIITAIEALSPDLIVLQEVAWKGGLHEDMMARLADLGWTANAYGGVIDSPTLRYGNLIASRVPLTLDESNWAPGVPYKQSLTRAVAHFAEDAIIIGAHIPNGSGNGWRKIETLEALAGALNPEVFDGPVIVVGDFNEPRLILDDGTVIPFTMRQTKDGLWSPKGMITRKCGRRFPRQRWIEGVRSILGSKPTVDLVHTARVTDGPGAWHTTHQVRGQNRFFDHILVSSHWNVVAKGFDHRVRTDGISDHSMAWADLELKS